MSQFQCGGSSSQTRYPSLALVRPLPHQQADGTQTHPSVPAFMKNFPRIDSRRFPRDRIAVLAGPFGRLSPAIPESRVGYLRVTHPCATLRGSSEETFSFDLHVLSTPPAFVLSQDHML